MQLSFSHSLTLPMTSSSSKLNELTPLTPQKVIKALSLAAIQLLGISSELLSGPPNWFHFCLYNILLIVLLVKWINNHTFNSIDTLFKHLETYVPTQVVCNHCHSHNRHDFCFIHHLACLFKANPCKIPGFTVLGEMCHFFPVLVP